MKKEIKIHKWTPEEIKDLVFKGEITPYIKPTRYIHDSGFRCFEVGYCKIGSDNKISEKMALGTITDHIWFHNLLEGGRRGDGKFSLSIDLTKDGYIRFFRRFFWLEDIAMSTAELSFLDQTGAL